MKEITVYHQVGTGPEGGVAIGLTSENEDMRQRTILTLEEATILVARIESVLRMEKDSHELALREGP